MEAPEVSREQLQRVHDPAYLDRIEASMPTQGKVYLDDDTPIGAHSLKAARRAAGALVMAVDLVLNGEVDNAFCSVRPPGHHAEKNRTMGFCIYNNVAVGAAHALEAHKLQRVAIVDFDVHHGNGTENIFKDEPRVMFCNTFQYPFYPDLPFEENGKRIINTPLDATTRSKGFRDAVETQWLPALDSFQPEMIFISAGFDAHVADEMSGVSLTEADYGWVTEKIRELAERHALGRIVSTLEGGYETYALGRSVEAHLRALMRL
jgi:acetoin utilization deacetylase AcuC-like enzyme